MEVLQAATGGCDHLKGVYIYWDRIVRSAKREAWKLCATGCKSLKLKPDQFTSSKKSIMKVDPWQRPLVILGNRVGEWKPRAKIKRAAKLWTIFSAGAGEQWRNLYVIVSALNFAPRAEWRKSEDRGAWHQGICRVLWVDKSLMWRLKGPLSFEPYFLRVPVSSVRYCFITKFRTEGGMQDQLQGSGALDIREIAECCGIISILSAGWWMKASCKDLVQRLKGLLSFEPCSLQLPVSSGEICTLLFHH